MGTDVGTGVGTDVGTSDGAYVGKGVGIGVGTGVGPRLGSALIVFPPPQAQHMSPAVKSSSSYHNAAPLHQLGYKR